MAKGDIVFINLPLPPGGSGHEQSGLRPGIIMSTAENPSHNMMTIIPLTSKEKAERFPYTMRIEPSVTNGLSLPSIALLFQLSSFDQSRIQKVIGQLEPDYISKIDTMIKSMLGL